MIDFDLRQTMKAVLAQGRDEARCKDLTLKAFIEPEVPRGLSGNEACLRRSLHLLVGHAVGSTDHGEITASVRLLHRMDDEVAVRFEVADTAPCLLVEGSETVFPGLQDARDPADVDLALWQQLVQLFADELGVSSGPDEGNTFWFSARFRAHRLGRTLEVSPMTVESRRILVVEDNLVNQKVAARIIEKLGYAVDVVADGAEALEAIERESYGLILMDCQMPVMDGYEATEEIRRREGAHRRTPIVALTAHAMETNRQRCLDIGMDDFVTKPVTSDQLQRVLDNWLSPPRVPAL